MQEFNLKGELVVTGDSAESYLNLEATVSTFYFQESIKLDELDSSIYELASPEGIYASSGLRNPSMLTGYEQKTIFDSIFQGVDQQIFQRVNQLTGKFMYLHGQGLLSTLGGILDLVTGVLDLVGLTDDLIQGVMGLFNGGGLESAITTVLGGLFGNAKVKDAISNGAKRSNEFAEDTSKRISKILEYETQVMSQGDGHNQVVVSGVNSILAGKSVTHANSSVVVEAPLITQSGDTIILNGKTEKHVNDYFSLQSQHADYTIDDSLTINSNVLATTSNNRRDVSRLSVFNSESHEQIATSNIHLQAGVYGKKSPIKSEVEITVTEKPKLTFSSTDNIYLYAGDSYFMQSKSISAIDSRYFFINTGTATIASIISRPRQIVEVTPLSNPEPIKTKLEVSENITIAEGNKIPVSSLGNKSSVNYTYDTFTKS